MPKLRAVPNLPPNSLSTAEMAAQLGCSTDTLYRNWKRGIYKQGLHFGILNPQATRVTLRWNPVAVLKLHGLAG